MNIITASYPVKKWWDEMDKERRLNVGSLAVKHLRMSADAKWNCNLKWDVLLTSQKKTLVYMFNHINNYLKED